MSISIRPIWLFCFCLLLGSSLKAQSPEVQQLKSPDKRDTEPPTLIIMISVDQMRYDYLIRFRDQFQGGFRRLLTGGSIFNNAHHVHALTGTGPGHATLSTGCYPSKHGITENDMYIKASGTVEYAVNDKSCKLVGTDGIQVEGMSPVNLMVSTIGDRLREASPNSKVFSVAFKDRASILMGGKKPNKAFWFDNATGRFISSTYYGTDYPAWANNMSGYQLFKADIERGWHRMYDESAYVASREDDFPAENGRFLATFPHTKDRMQPYLKPAMKNAQMMWLSPMGDRFSFEFSKKLIQEERLGKDTDPDLLFIGCSTADAIGHHYGPMSQETQDYYLWLDKYLGEFMDFLDTELGKGRYLLVLTADHGVMPMPEELKRQGKPGLRVSSETYRKALRSASAKVKQVHGLQNPIIVKASSTGIALDYREALAKGISEEKLRSEMAKALKIIPFVSDAFTSDEMLNPQVRRKYIDYYRRSFYPGRSYDIKLRFKQYVLADTGNTGVSHGTPYKYDTHVPIIFYGNSVPQAGIPRQVASVDIAPTLAAWLQLPVPMDMDGQLLPEVVKW